MTPDRYKERILAHCRLLNHMTKGKSCPGLREESGKYVVREFADLKTPVMAEGNTYRELWDKLCPRERGPE